MSAGVKMGAIIAVVVAVMMVFPEVLSVSAQDSLAFEQVERRSRLHEIADVFTDGALKEYPFHDHYPSIDELYAWYDDIVTEYPDLVTKIHIGHSWEGRDLWVLQVTSDEDTQVDYKPGVLVDGLIHAREWSTTQVAAYFIWRLLTDYDTDATIHWLLNNRRIYVMPMLNPDGYVFDGDGAEVPGNFWRKNRNNSTPTDDIGVDLNRNWDHYWESGNSDPGSKFHRGGVPFSEYETEFMRQFVLGNRIDSYQNLHSYAGVLLFPWFYISDSSPHDDWFRGMAAHMTSLTSRAGDESLHYSCGQPYEVQAYNVSGSAVDWSYAMTGAQAFALEIKTGGYGFYPITELIMTINEDVYDALVYQARVSDVDLGDGSDLLFPPIPYIVYGTVTDLGGSPVAAITVALENLDTEETLFTTADMNGYYELNYGNLVEHGYSITNAFALSACAFSTHFTIGDEWGIMMDIEIAMHDLTVSCTAGGLVSTPGEGMFTYPEGTVVDLAAESREGYRFVRWTGDVDTIDDIDAVQTTIDMDGDYSIRANFKTVHPFPWWWVVVGIVVVGLLVYFLWWRRRKR